ncbi:MAG: DUF4288 domain-containing protein [Gomphosphaeria aponina SAG 52.96 = DSM 107014]|uniref:DUF4288 domain-containing protein n=1 Tax=Gomphosphaeria aponina SAG 52.96 = DSM 107014 TaxID=1521640 RepID=A0A941GTE3_9CHRO|nr:DUF4288 domain-containing protein [Gomphosphaeria aponina SAG 52.96 = DSM 107014]
MINETIQEKPSFYVAVLLYESSSTAPDDQPFYQEGFVLIKATSKEEAEKKAWKYGLEEQVSYHNENKNTITWSLKQVVDVNSVLYDEFEDERQIDARNC